MISNPELRVYEDHMQDSLHYTFSWESEGLKHQSGILISAEMIGKTSNLSIFQILRLRFLEELRDFPEAQYSCLLSLEQHFDQTEMYGAGSVTSTNNGNFNLKIESLSSESQNLLAKYGNLNGSLQNLSDQIKETTKFFSSFQQQVTITVNDIHAKVIAWDVIAQPPQKHKPLSAASNSLPGILEVVNFPCKRHTDCLVWQNTENSLHSTIMQLNDNCEWTREEIADWIETLDIDTTFKVSTEPTKRSKKIV